MQLSRDGKTTKILLGLFFLLVIGYAYFEAQGFLFGPSITLGSMAMEVHDPLVTITGQAARISSLSMNGSPITVTEDGGFSEPYILAPGDNRVVLDATDKYGRSKRQIMHFVYMPPAASSTPTNTASTTTPAVNTDVSASTSPMTQ